MWTCSSKISPFCRWGYAIPPASHRVSTHRSTVAPASPRPGRVARRPWRALWRMRRRSRWRRRWRDAGPGRSSALALGVAWKFWDFGWFWYCSNFFLPCLLGWGFSWDGSVSAFYSKVYVKVMTFWELGSALITWGRELLLPLRLNWPKRRWEMLRVGNHSMHWLGIPWFGWQRS